MYSLRNSRPIDPALSERLHANVEAVAPFLQVARVTKGPFFIADSYRRSYRAEPPMLYYHHYVAFYRRAVDHFVPLGYSLMYPHGKSTLVRGSLTDGRRFEHVSQTHSDAIREVGGVKVLVLSQAIIDLGDYCEAFFAYSGNERARKANAQVGFEATAHRYLMALFHKPCHRPKQRRLIAEARRASPF